MLWIPLQGVRRNRDSSVKQYHFIISIFPTGYFYLALQGVCIWGGGMGLLSPCFPFFQEKEEKREKVLSNIIHILCSGERKGGDGAKIFGLSLSRGYIGKKLFSFWEYSLYWGITIHWCHNFSWILHHTTQCQMSMLFAFLNTFYTYFVISLSPFSEIQLFVIGNLDIIWLNKGIEKAPSGININRSFLDIFIVNKI